MDSLTKIKIKINAAESETFVLLVKPVAYITHNAT